MTSRKTRQEQQKDAAGQAEERDRTSRKTRQDKQKDGSEAAKRRGRTSRKTRQHKQKDERGQTERRDITSRKIRQVEQNDETEAAETTGSARPAPSGKHHRHTCKRAFLLKRALVQTRKQLPGLRHRRMRACMCVYSVFRAGRAVQSQLFRLLAFRSSAGIAPQGPPRPENTIHTHARAHLF